MKGVVNLQIFIDSANVDKIAELNEFFPISGVTTNPSLLVKEDRHFMETLVNIRDVLGDDKKLFVQTIGSTAEDIIKEAHYVISRLSGNNIIKVPVTKEGIKAIKLLSKDGIEVLGTTIYTPLQAMIAALSGAQYVAPYVNRIDNLTRNGINVVREINKLFCENQISSKILAASFKNLQQVHFSCVSGAHSLTLPPDLMKKLIYYPETDNDLKKFINEWGEYYGEDNLKLHKS